MEQNVRGTRNSIVALAMILALALSPWAIATAYVKGAGIVAQGEVVGKRESFLMPGGDRARHVLEITYRYQTSDSHGWETASHQVDPSLYSRLRIGSAVRVRYSSWYPLRLVKGVGSVLDDSSWSSRLPGESGSARKFAELGALAAALLLAVVAYRRNSRPLGLVAGLVGATWVSAVLLAGFLVFPILFWAWRRQGRGFGWVLLGSMALSTAALYWRIPRPAPMPSGPQHEATAIVRQVRVVTEIWGSVEDAGQGVRQPFQMADLEFTPKGATEPVHVLDRVDLDSVPGLTEGAAVLVSYPIFNPRAGRIAGGTRTYARQALVYILGLTYAVAATLAFLVFPAIRLAERLLRSSTVLGAMIAPGEVERLISRLPDDHPRRKAFEKDARARHDLEQAQRRRADA